MRAPAETQPPTGSLRLRGVLGARHEEGETAAFGVDTVATRPSGLPLGSVGLRG